MGGKELDIDKKKGMRSVSPEREDKEKELQWQFGQGTSENKMIGCKPTSPPLTQQHLQESLYYSWMCLCEGILGGT